MPIGILTVLLFLGLLTVRLVLLPSEVLTYLQVPTWAFWFLVLSVITWLLRD
ncbi:MAG: hypothetical protein KME10_09400 [Plectolyngbya sp. WJT66-NPBG17]|jgi:hypothetical protein|nr:hypothetical protein [Plectolyngbya sp. WJT66-NPBG17]MBW4525722.1 hypothetical protein [Phormidium tanganyikae FI6-MK23]